MSDISIPVLKELLAAIVTTRQIDIEGVDLPRAYPGLLFRARPLAERVIELSEENLRLFDLVRNQRGQLFLQEMISHEEYGDLMTDARAEDSVKRLTNYDEMRRRIAALEEGLLFPKFPTECIHDEEPDYCMCCQTIFDEAMAAWKDRAAELLKGKA